MTAALTAVARASTKVRKRQDALADAQAERDALMLAAREEGATYPALAEASGLTRDRVNQVLAAQRRAASV